MEKEGKSRKQEGRQQTDVPYILPNRAYRVLVASGDLLHWFDAGLMFDKEASSS